ncbi:hypothetical protein GCM10020258_27660 [Sphingomonas yabuuchiae]
MSNCCNAEPLLRDCIPFLSFNGSYHHEKAGNYLHLGSRGDVDLGLLDAEGAAIGGAGGAGVAAATGGSVERGAAVGGTAGAVVGTVAD